MLWRYTKSRSTCRRGGSGGELCVDVLYWIISVVWRHGIWCLDTLMSWHWHFHGMLLYAWIGNCIAGRDGL